MSCKVENANFKRWLRADINSQADAECGNAVALDDFTPDGMHEYCYPKEFSVYGDDYRWTVSSTHTRRRHLCTHYEIWFFGRAFGPGLRIATGPPTEPKIRKGLRIIFDYYQKGTTHEAI